MRVIVIGNVAHVVVNGPWRLSELGVGHVAKRVMEVTLDFGRRRCVVYSPHDHRYEANLAVTNPTGVVFEVTLGHDGRFAKLAAVAHFTVRVTCDSHATIVPALGLSETTVVHLVELEFGPVVEKYSEAFFIAA